MTTDDSFPAIASAVAVDVDSVLRMAAESLFVVSAASFRFAATRSTGGNENPTISAAAWAAGAGFGGSTRAISSTGFGGGVAALDG